MKTPELDERTIEWIKISLLEGIGEKRLKTLILTLKDPFAIYEKDIKELTTLLPKFEKIFKQIKNTNKDITDYKKRLQDYDVDVLTILDQNYPNVLREIGNPPPILYLRGSFKKEDRLAISIVGSRTASYYGKKIARKFSRSLVNMGFTIVSGMARGIDTAAHQATIEGGGRTIAFLGSGIDVVYPKENKPLLQRIIKNGAVVSEFPLGTEPVAINFPQRNRLISGMSLGIVVIEATLKSGTFTTVKWALEQGKEIFAVPGDILSRTSMGTNKLIQRGAKLIVDTEDIIEEFPFLKRKDFAAPLPTEEVELTAGEKRVYETLRENPILIDDIIEKIKLPSSKVSSVLLSLEIKGLVQQLPGKRFTKREI
ncbi:MAG: DNA-protecting protein DprA [Candidatus Cloacimonadota bacterium]|nr:MAG: DNA-protecting protein DprA [Candidatus Cloacimonadota bacterium]